MTEIRSRAGNWALVLTGGAALVAGIAGTLAEMVSLGRFDPGALLLLAFPGGLGAWCLAGGVIGLRRDEGSRQPRSLLDRLVLADIVLIFGSAATALACLAPEWESMAPRLLGLGVLYLLFLGLLAAPVLLVVTVVRRLRARVAARRPGAGSGDTA
jgi:hypothetical protein